jgi:hypothetical protein
MRFGQRADGAIEQEIFGTLRNERLIVHLPIGLHAERLGHIEFALHHIEVAIDLRQAAFGFDEDKTIMPSALTR